MAFGATDKRGRHLHKTAMGFALFRRTPLPDPAHLDVRFEDRSFQVSLRRRPQARRITLRISSATGAVVLTLPQRTDLSTAQRFADAHGGWIATRLERLPQRVALRAGVRVPFRGVPHRIFHWSKVSGATEATLDDKGQPVIAVACEPGHVARRVREFLGARGQEGTGQGGPALQRRGSRSRRSASPCAIPRAAGGPARPGAT
jgi:hypothetical protein